MLIKRGIYLLFIILLIIPIVNALNQTIILEEDNTTILNGKSITILDIAAGNNILVQVDGQRDIVRQQPKTINGVTIFVEDYLARSVLININIPFVCGDGQCKDGENSQVCCKDCGCSASEECTNNQCIDPSLNQCNTNNDCDDNNKCTIDTCINAPRVCNHETIFTCTSNDGCCPVGCTLQLDNDCTNECTTDEECNVNKQSSVDKCVDRSCVLTPECQLDGKCYNQSTIIDDDYRLQNQWHALKKDNESCTNDFECESGVCGERCGMTTTTILNLNKKELNFDKSTVIVVVILALLIIVEGFVLLNRR